MSPEIKRLEILLMIGQEHNYCFDELDDWTLHLNWQEFQDWSRDFLSAQRRRFLSAQGWQCVDS